MDLSKRNEVSEIMDFSKHMDNNSILEFLYNSERYDAVLSFACKIGNKKYVSKSLKAGANYNFVDNTDITPLMNICHKGHDILILELLNAKADPNEKNSIGGTALIIACAKGHHLCVRELIRADANINLVDCNGWTALMIACDYGHEQCTRQLLEAHADPNKATPDGWTALLSAAQSGHDLCARAVLENGANLEAQTLEPPGFTALMLSCQNGHEQCVRLLLEAKANLEAQQNQGFTALMLSCQNGHELCAHTLLEKGAAVSDIEVVARYVDLTPYFKNLLKDYKRNRKKKNRQLRFNKQNAIADEELSRLKFKALVDKYAKFIRANDEATAKNIIESAERRNMRERINEKKANKTPKPYTPSGPFHCSKYEFVVDPLTSIDLAEDAKQQAQKMASIEATFEHRFRLKKRQEEEDMRIAECKNKIRIGKEIGGN